MKNILKRKNIIIILLFSIIVMIPMMFNYRYVGHDFEFHYINIKSILESLSFNNWFVNEPLTIIAGTFGYGTRFFYPPLPHLSAAYVFKFLQIFNINSILLSMRIIDWLTILLSGITFFLCAKKVFKNERISLLGSLFYMSAPYHLAEIYIRDAFSEMFIFIALPLIILGLLELKDENYKKFYIYFTLGYVIALYSHLSLSIYLTLILLLTFFPIYFKEIFKKKSIIYLIISSISILLFTAPFWLPLLEIKLSTDYAIFVPFYLTAKGDLQYSTLVFKDYLGFMLKHNYDYIRYHLQLSSTIMVIGSLVIFLKNKLWRNKTKLFFISFFFLSIIMTTRIFPWKYTPGILQTLQFPWRLALLVSFSGIILVMLFLDKFKDKRIFSKLCLFLVIFSLGELFYNTYHLNKKPDLDSISPVYGMGNEKEYLPFKTHQNKEYLKERGNDILVTGGNTKINILKDELKNLIFEIELDDQVKIELPRIYYIGYELQNDTKKIELKESEYGFLEANINESGTYELKYTGTKLMKISYILLSVNIILHLGYIIWTRKKDNDIIKK